MQPECLTVANDYRHASIVSRVKAAIEELRLAGKRISFYAVANKGQVSRSTLYRSDDLRKLVEEARGAAEASKAQIADNCSSIAKLESELARVSAERDEFKRIAGDAVAIRYFVTQLSCGIGYKVKKPARQPAH